MAAIPETSGDLSDDALREFSAVAKSNPAAPWKLETGHLRGGRELLEQMTGRSWESIDLTADDVQAAYEALTSDERTSHRTGMAAALVAFLGVCVKYRYGLEGGAGARLMRR